jgi:hypothetical protein
MERTRVGATERRTTGKEETPMVAVLSFLPLRFPLEIVHPSSSPPSPAHSSPSSSSSSYHSSSFFEGIDFHYHNHKKKKRKRNEVPAKEFRV